MKPTQAIVVPGKIAAMLLFWGVIIAGPPIRAAETKTARSADPIMDLDIDALANVRINIASIGLKPIEAQPAVVTVITAQEIEARGAKDLKDILELVPGFTSGYDVASMVGPGFRGIWAYEGKVQVLVDGIEMNEGYFGNVFTLDQFAAQNIKQVEILRGPGSAMYGGTAEMAVISITTKGAELNGGFVSDRMMYNGHDFGNQVTSSFGYQLTNDWRISGNVAYSDVERSDKTYVSPDGTVLRNLAGNSADRPLELNLGLGWKDAEVRVLYNRYQAQDQIVYGMKPYVEPQGSPGIIENNILALSAKGDLKVADWLVIAPRVTYKFEEPWYMTYPATGTIQHRQYQRGDIDLPVKIEFNESSKAVLGVHYYHEYARAITITGVGGQSADDYFNGSDHIAHDDVAVYAQYDLDSRWVNITVGARYEYYSYSGGAFVPRLGLVKAWDRFHIKVLYNEAFRTPNIGIVHDAAGPLKNESTTGYELEAGYRFNGGFTLVGNLYYMRIRNMIGFDSGKNAYANGGPISTEGVELQLRYTSKPFDAMLGYSYSRADEQGFPLYSSAPTLQHLNLNMPAHQVTWSTDWHITRTLNWNVSGTFLSERAAYAFPNTATPGRLDPEFLLHTYLDYRWRQFNLGVGVRNLLDEDELLGQPYSGGSGPLPLSGRTFFAQLGVRF
jgi:outer membrane receptor protein involved in Fe transport